MKQVIKYGLPLALITVTFNNCSYSESALQYANEGTKRVQSGYQAKAEMTKYLVEYLKVANANCGTTMEVIDGKPIVKVKECVDVDDVLASVDSVEIVKPQQVKDMLDSAGDFVMKSTGMIVPLAGIYGNYMTHESSMKASIANTASNNAMQTSMYGNFTNNFDKTTTTTIDSSNNTSSDVVTTTTDTSVVNTSDVEKFPSVFNTDTNTTIME
jgi:hypothetical protein